MNDGSRATRKKHGSPAGNATTSGRGMPAGALTGGFPANGSLTMAKLGIATRDSGILIHTGFPGESGPPSACPDQAASKSPKVCV